MQAVIQDRGRQYIVNDGDELLVDFMAGSEPGSEVVFDRVLGSGSATILSRGYGNCRITSTGTRRVWWVQYFSSQDAMILNTLEVTDVPAVACASQEDLEDSTERLQEILEVYR